MKETATLTRRASGVITRSAKASGALAAVSLGALQSRKGGKNGSVHSHPDRCKGKPHAWLYGTDNAVCSTCGRTVPKAQATNQPDPVEAKWVKPTPLGVTYAWRWDMHDQVKARDVMRNLVTGQDMAEVAITPAGKYRWWLLVDPSVNSDKELNQGNTLDLVKGRVREAVERWQREKDYALTLRAKAQGVRSKAKAVEEKKALLENTAALARLLAESNAKQVLKFGAEGVKKLQAQARRLGELRDTHWYWHWEGSPCVPGARVPNGADILQDDQGNRLAKVAEQEQKPRYVWQLLRDTQQTGGDEDLCAAQDQAKAAALALEWKLANA